MTLDLDSVQFLRKYMFCHFILTGDMYLSGMWLDVDLKMETIKTCI